MNKGQKTIFIIIARGFTVRNVLRSGVLEGLKQRGIKVVLFFVNIRGRELPAHLREEFENEYTVVEVVKNLKEKIFYSRFSGVVRFFVYNIQNRKTHYTTGGKNKLLLLLEYMLFLPLSKITVLKKAVRLIEQKLFLHGSYARYFEKYQPDLVFSPSIISTPDIEFMKEARNRGIKTVSMPRGWDNITTRLYRFVPDLLLVQNNTMKKEAIRLQKMHPENIRVVGFSQFDWHRRPDIILRREEFLKQVGLDPTRKLIVWGSTGIWTPKDNSIAETVAEFINHPEGLDVPASLLVRSHFTDAKNKRFDYLKKQQNVFIDESFNTSEFFYDNCDPHEREIRWFVNTIYHADVVITLCSTLTLDALCHNKPIINTAFGAVRNKNGKDVTPSIYGHDHYQPILENNAVDLVKNKKELLESLKRNLNNPLLKATERMQALDILCHKVDGNSSKRVAEAVTSLASR